MTTEYKNEPLERLKRRYEGTAYIGVAMGEFGVTESHASIWQMVRRPGDSDIVPLIATKGWEARTEHTERFLKSGHDWLLLLDGDMGIPPMLLERMRSHGLPCVTGHYLRRGFNPMRPIWFEDDPEFRWPMMPFRFTPESGRLYRLGGTGSGCWLIHRVVIEDVKVMLKGEPFFCDDPMTWWPYDVEAVAAGREKLRVLRGTKDRVGSDLRLSFFIRQAGYTIWGDPDASCGHYLQYPISLRDWYLLDPATRKAYERGTEHDLEGLREQQMGIVERIRKAGEAAGGLMLVGEPGPELVGLPRGSNVFTLIDSRKEAMFNGT